jgi:5-methylcytosine-specific restriction endonuclease McrA
MATVAIRKADKQAMATNPRTTNGALRRKLRARVLASSDRCALCGLPIDKSLKTPHPLSPEVDEILPVSRGGSPYDIANLQLVHRACNRRKSNHIQSQAPLQALPLPHSRGW